MKNVARDMPGRIQNVMDRDGYWVVPINYAIDAINGFSMNLSDKWFIRC